MVSLGDFQGNPGKAFDQCVECFGRQHVGELGALAVLWDVLGSAAVGAGQLVGIVDADAVDQRLQRVGQLADIDVAQVWQFHMALLRDGCFGMDAPGWRECVTRSPAALCRRCEQIFCASQGPSLGGIWVGACSFGEQVLQAAISGAVGHGFNNWL
ncbi:hypothetical protein D9M71_554270 [compost metagenome]